MRARATRIVKQLGRSDNVKAALKDSVHELTLTAGSVCTGSGGDKYMLAEMQHQMYQGCCRSVGRVLLCVYCMVLLYVDFNSDPRLYLPSQVSS